MNATRKHADGGRVRDKTVTKLRGVEVLLSYEKENVRRSSDLFFRPGIEHVSNKRVEFPASARLALRVGLDVYHVTSDDEGRLVLQLESFGGLSIEPVASNMVRIRTTRR